MPTTTPDPTQIAAEQKVLAPQTMPEERTNQNVLEAGGCSWRDDVVENGYTWNPRVLPYGEVQCVSCACKVNFLNYLLLSSKDSRQHSVMAVRVLEFSNGGFKIRKIFA